MRRRSDFDRAVLASACVPGGRLACSALVVVALARPVVGQQSAAQFTPPEDVSFRTATIMSEGTRMAAEVFAPKKPATEKLPTIIMSHGWGGVAAVLRGDAVEFARAGFLVVTFDYRGWGASDSRFSHQPAAETYQRPAFHCRGAGSSRGGRPD